MAVDNLIKEQCMVKNGPWLRPAEWFLAGLSAYALLYCLLGRAALPPDGSLFLIVSLALLAQAGGRFVSVFRLPPLLGMLLVGVLLRNVGFFYVKDAEMRRIVTISRDVALGVILTKAGLGLDAGALRRMSFTVVRLAFCPCVVEALTAALASHYIANLPWLWALLLGFLLAAVSPAVVVPSLLALKEKGYGEDKGIATLVVAASSVDDIAAISFFGIFLAMIFSPGGNLAYQILSGPLELAIGLSAGMVWGFVSALTPHREYEHVVALRVSMLGSGGLCAVLGSKMVGFPGAGPLACITASFIGGLCWGLQGWPNVNPVSRFFSNSWLIMQPILFGLIGSEINLSEIETNDVSSGLLVLLICLSVRVVICFLVLFGDKLNLKEMFFISLAWLPKATVQAALSTVALELVKKQEAPSEEDVARATMLLTTSVMAILITAPIGSVAISLSAPYLLSKPVPTVETLPNA